ncbi:MAG TPA: hypothetical protein VH763_12065 [Gemmatimonadales bacterium]|jgi:hypothetical protein
MNRVLTRSLRVLGGGTAAAALLGLTYIAGTWYRYGRTRGNRQTDPLLDRFLPIYEVGERHQTIVRAPASITYEAARELDLQESGLIRAIFAGRELLMRAKPARPQTAGPFLQQVLALGWGILADEPGHELVLGAVTQPWKANVSFRSLPPEEFTAFHEPGYAKIAWTLAVEPVEGGSSVFRTETRVATTDPSSRARFRRYWSVFSPGILLIRWETLRLVKRNAERRADRQALQLSSEEVSGDLHIIEQRQPAPR